MFVLSIKPLKNLTGTDGQAGRQTDRQTDGQDHVFSQADALTKNDSINEKDHIKMYITDNPLQGSSLSSAEVPVTFISMCTDIQCAK